MKARPVVLAKDEFEKRVREWADAIHDEARSEYLKRLTGVRVRYRNYLVAAVLFGFVVGGALAALVLPC